MFYDQKFLSNKPRLISRVFCALIMISSEEALAKNTIVAPNSHDLKATEEMIATASAAELPKLEIKIARILQENPRDLYGNYLMTTMISVNPG